MDIINLKQRNTVNYWTKRLLSKVEENEPNITKDLKALAKSNDVEMAGLENKFKSKNSLERKLIDESIRRNIPIERVAKRNNDALRYTFLLDEENYNKSFQDILSDLRKSGYDVPNNRIWNAWDLEGSEMDTGYRGINVTVISSQKQKFELQFHTAESFRLKTETHDLYKEFRNSKTSDERKIEITKEMLKLAEKVKRPKGI